MAKPNEPYQLVLVESYAPSATSGLHGEIHIRPCEGQGYPTDMHVSCAKELKRDYPVGTRFRIKAKLTDRGSGGEYLYSHHQSKYEVVR